MQRTIFSFMNWRGCKTGTATRCPQLMQSCFPFFMYAGKTHVRRTPWYKQWHGERVGESEWHFVVTAPNVRIYQCKKNPVQGGVVCNNCCSGCSTYFFARSATFFEMETGEATKQNLTPIMPWLTGEKHIHLAASPKSELLIRHGKNSSVNLAYE